MEIIKIKIDELKPYKKNAKIHTQEQIDQIKSSIEKFGMNDPVAVWGNENLIIEGHGRLEALKQLGFEEVECIRLDHLNDEERKAYTLAHNKLTMNTDFDFDVLDEELNSILNIDMEDFGFFKVEEELEKEEEKPEVEFSEVIGEEHNYIVLYFDNDVDWLQAESLFDIKPVKCGSTRKDGKITNSMQRVGIGRVLNGSDALNKILGVKNENIN